MAAALADPVQRRACSSGGDLAAIVLVVDGRRQTWRAAGLACDPDVTAWAQDVLCPARPDYASLFWGELLALRASRNDTC